MCGHTIIDRMKNQELIEKLEIAPLLAKVREDRLKWIGRVKRKTADTPVRMVESLIVEGKRSQGCKRT